MSVSASRPRTHRFALCLSGGVSLGAYEAGVVLQLYRSVSAFNEHPQIQSRASLRIDAIAGASAGAVTGLALGQAIAVRRSPAELETRLRSCWVDMLNLENLLSDPSGEDPDDALFTDTIMRQVSLVTVDSPPDEALGDEPICLWMALTNLEGIPYVVRFGREESRALQTSTEIYGLEHRDAAPFLINGSNIWCLDDRLGAVAANPSPVDVAAKWQAAVGAAQASSAFPGAFRPSVQQRELRAYPGYQCFRRAADGESAGAPPAHAFPDRASFHFVDGGLFNNEPIGNAIDAVQYLNRIDPRRSPLQNPTVSRSYLVVEPDPVLPAELEAQLQKQLLKGDPLPIMPLTVLGQVVDGYFSEALTSDFRTAAQTNARLEKLERVWCQAMAGLPVEQQKLLEDVKGQILDAVGLAGKDLVTLDRIPAHPACGHRLAGAFAGHFGGFLKQEYREADFITGQREAWRWMRQWTTLFLQAHAEELGMEAREICAEFAASVIGPEPAIPAGWPNAPDHVAAFAGWFPRANMAEARAVALSPQEREEAARLGFSRGITLLRRWLREPGWVRLLRAPADWLLWRMVKSRWVEGADP